jgi:hypothetical protein
MHQIMPHPLWVGHAGDGRDFRQLFDAGIRAVVQLAMEETPIPLPREIIYCRFPLLDGPSNPDNMLFLAINTVLHLLQLRIPTLVCCGAGLSRSPAIAAAVLSVAFGQPLEESLRLVHQYRPCDLSPGFWNDITQLLRPSPSN